MDKERYYVGTELKIAIDIQCEGFDMNENDWTCTVKKGNKSVICTRTQNSAWDGENWYLLVDTSVLGKGTYVLVVDIDVPDLDFKDNLRHETYRQELFNVHDV